MDKGSLGARDQRAQERILAAARTLAERFELPFGVTDLTVQARDPLVRAMMQRERVAGLLENLVAATAPRKRGRPRGTDTDVEAPEVSEGAQE